MPKPLVSPKADPCPKLGKREANFVACQEYRHSLSKHVSVPSCSIPGALVMLLPPSKLA